VATPLAGLIATMEAGREAPSYAISAKIRAIGEPTWAETASLDSVGDLF
jgi:hypothetical protein